MSIPSINGPEEISRETIERIRKLPAERFEPTFIAQLKAERRLSLVIIYFMQEAFRRRIWAQNYASFSKYCTEHLRMSEADFYRKFSILKTIEEIPEIEEKILGGEMNASTVAKMSHFFHRESKLKGAPVTVEKKREVFKQMEGLSHRQVERELAILSPQAAMPDKTRQITETAFVRQFTSTQELEDKIKRAKELLAHSLPQPPTDCHLFTKITDIALERIDPMARQRRLEGRAKKSVDDAGERGEFEGATGAVNADRAAGSSEPSGTATSAKDAKRAYLPESLRREILMRDGFACVHVNHSSGLHCGSKYALEIDHILPVAQGGDNSPENLRVLCRVHNQLRAIEVFGRKKMSEHIRSL